MDIIPDDVLDAIVACQVKCEVCPAATQCTPDCLVNVSRQLLADMAATTFLVRAIDATLYDYFTTGEDFHGKLTSIAELVKQIKPHLRKDI